MYVKQTVTISSLFIFFNPNNLTYRILTINSPGGVIISECSRRNLFSSASAETHFKRLIFFQPAGDFEGGGAICGGELIVKIRYMLLPNRTLIYHA